MAKKRGMGIRGLSALTGAKHKSDNNVAELRVDKLAIDSLVAGVYQPRQQFDQEALQELADSIKLQGIVQPIIVKASDTEQYEIIAGERRWRAAKLAGLQTVPAVIRKADNQTTLAMALIENMQRQDLNPLEEALGLQRLMIEFDLSQQAVADAIGRSRSAVTNLLRLLKLPEAIQTSLHQGALSMGHARALLSLPSDLQSKVAEQAIAEQWSVREIEQAVQAQPIEAEQANQSKRAPKPQVAEPLKQQGHVLAQTLGVPVKLKLGQRGKGKIEIAYQSAEEAEQILQKLLAFSKE